MFEPISVAVIDEQPLFREGVCSVLASWKHCERVARGCNYDEALNITKSFKPNVMLLDFHLPGGGLNALKAISETGSITKTIMLTATQREDDLSASFRAGARGYTAKDVAAEQLVSIVKTVHDGGLYTEPTFASELLAQRYVEKHKETDVFRSLTKRERDILSLVSEGMTNKEIAARFKISEKTVKHYMTSLMQKLQVRNRVEAALIARKTMKNELTQHARAQVVPRKNSHNNGTSMSLLQFAPY